MEVILLALFPQFILRSHSQKWYRQLHVDLEDFTMGAQQPVPSQMCLHTKLAGDLECSLGLCLCHWTWEAELVWESLERLIWESICHVLMGKERWCGPTRSQWEATLISSILLTSLMILHRHSLGWSPSLRGTGTSWSTGDPREKGIGTLWLGKRSQNYYDPGP